MAIKLKDLLMLLAVLLGMASAISWLTIPFWVFLIIIIVYVLIGFSSFDDWEIKL